MRTSENVRKGRKKDSKNWNGGSYDYCTISYYTTWIHNSIDDKITVMIVHAWPSCIINIIYYILAPEVCL